MIKAALPCNEIERLKTLGSFNLLEPLPEKDFDNITFPASVICQRPINLISLVDKERQFFKSHLGLDDNQIIDVEIRVNALKFDSIDLICSTFIDVTERKKQEEQWQLLRLSSFS